MTKPTRNFILMLAVMTLLQSALGFAAAEASPTKGARTQSGAQIALPNKDLEKVAAAWRRMFGEVVTVADRAKSRKVSIELSAPSKAELRTMMVSALREDGVHVIESSNGLVFDTEPAVKQSK